jgi:hypothetical protein
LKLKEQEDAMSVSSDEIAAIWDSFLPTIHAGREADEAVSAAKEATVQAQVAANSWNEAANDAREKSTIAAEAALDVLKDSSHNLADQAFLKDRADRTAKAAAIARSGSEAWAVAAAWTAKAAAEAWAEVARAAKAASSKAPECP